MDKDSIGNRMKTFYENRARFFLNRKTPVILRLDGKAFHTLTKNMDKPFDKTFITFMNDVMMFLVRNIQGCKMGYVQSDEISLVLSDLDTNETDAWFDYNLQKMVSVAASMATQRFIRNYKLMGVDICANFDCRAFNIPIHEVRNYFIWRQQDWERNSLSMFALKFFTQKELHGKNKQMVHDMLHDIGENWANLEDYLKNGFVYINGQKDDKSSGSIIFKNMTETLINNILKYE